MAGVLCPKIITETTNGMITSISYACFAEVLKLSSVGWHVTCRQCFEIKCLDTAPFAGRCIKGDNAVSVIVQITDICPECTADHLDIQALTYNKLSPMETGRINIQYR